MRATRPSSGATARGRAHVALLGVALVAVALRLPAAEREVAGTVAAARSVRHVGEVRVPPAYPDANPLVRRAHEVIPPGVPVRIVVRGVSCTPLPERNGTALVFWLQHELLPHPASCRADEPWQVWADADTVPPGAEVVAPGYAIVRR